MLTPCAGAEKHRMVALIEGNGFVSWCSGRITIALMSLPLWMSFSWPVVPSPWARNRCSR